MVGRVETLRNTVRAGIINGDLHTNTPLGMRADDIRPQIQGFFRNQSGYAQANAAQIQELKTFSPLDGMWAGVTKTPQRVMATVENLDGNPNPLTRGGAVELQRNGLTQAVANAYHAGRLDLSEHEKNAFENVMGEEATRQLRAARGQLGEVSMQLLVGEASARNLTRAGGLLTTGADAVITARAASALMELGNTTAAQAEIDHAVARNVGGWAGGASTAAALGGTGFVPAALAVADAVLMSKAFDKAVDLKENREIFNQTDKAGVDWTFDGRSWGREAAIDRGLVAQGGPVEQRVIASYEKSQELGAIANRAAVELALGKAPPPQDPFNLPAKPSDQIGLDNQNWQRNPDSQAWEREVKTGVSGANDRGIYELQAASPEQTQRLNQEALGRVEGNIANGREAIAAAYLENHAAQRAQDHGVNVPAAVESARAKPDQVLASDSHVYQRNDAGQWAGKDGVASGNLAVELELTHQMRQPSLERSQDALAAIQGRPAPTAAQAEQNEALHRYRSAGVDLNAQPDNLQAVELATQRTREAHGITGSTMQQLKPNEQGQYGYDSPIAHFLTGPDGVAHQVAITSPEEIRQVKAELGQPVASIPTLGTVSVMAPGSGKEQEPEQSQEKAPASQVLADNPAHADHHTYAQIHSWVSETGNWNEQESRNVSASLYRQQVEDPLMQRVDKVGGGLGQDGAHNVFAVYAPYGDQGPFLHTHVDGRQAAQEPAQQNLQQAELLQQTQARQQTIEQNLPQTQEQGPRMTM